MDLFSLSLSLTFILFPQDSVVLFYKSTSRRRRYSLENNKAEKNIKISTRTPSLTLSLDLRFLLKRKERNCVVFVFPIFPKHYLISLNFKKEKTREHPLSVCRYCAIEPFAFAKSLFG